MLLITVHISSKSENITVKSLKEAPNDSSVKNPFRLVTVHSVIRLIPEILKVCGFLCQLNLLQIGEQNSKIQNNSWAREKPKLLVTVYIFEALH
jgi:hypothetical protein